MSNFQNNAWQAPFTKTHAQWCGWCPREQLRGGARVGAARLTALISASGGRTPAGADFRYLRDVTGRAVACRRTRRVTQRFHHTDAKQANSLTNTDDSKTQGNNCGDEVRAF